MLPHVRTTHLYSRKSFLLRSIREVNTARRDPSGPTCSFHRGSRPERSNGTAGRLPKGEEEASSVAIARLRGWRSSRRGGSGGSRSDDDGLRIVRISRKLSWPESISYQIGKSDAQSD